MSYKKQKPSKTIISKSQANKNSKDEYTPKRIGDVIKRKKNYDRDDSPLSNQGTNGSRTAKKVKAKSEARGSNSPTFDEESVLKKEIDYDEFEEINDFLKSLNKAEPKSEKKEKEKEKKNSENNFDALRAQSKKMTQMAFQLFHKIGLSFDKIRPKTSMTSTVTSATKPKTEEQTINSSEEKMDVEDKSDEKKEEMNNEPPRSRPKLRNLLKINTFEDCDGKNDDILDNINFEPTIEMMRTSNHIDLDLVSNVLDHSKKKSDGDRGPNEFIPQKVSLEHLPENYQKINELVESISETDFSRLEPEVYLNDTLINFYLKLIELGLVNNERRNKIHIFNTYFMAKLRKLFSEMANDFSKFEQVYTKLERWTKKVDLFEKDFIFIPVNENEHWNQVVLCYPQRIYSDDDELPFVVFLDSICRMEEIYAKILFHLILREVKSKKPNEYVNAEKKIKKFKCSSFPVYQPMIPKQSNWTDCGLYLLQYIELFCEDESYILADMEDINKTRWFPRRLINDKRDDMKRLIRDLKSFKYDAITEYLEKRNRKMKDYAKTKDQFDNFDQKGFEKALMNKYDTTDFTEEERNILMLDYFYFGSLEYDQNDDMH